jgi:hypothetical protein
VLAKASRNLLDWTGKNDPSFVEEEAPFRNMHMSKREEKSWSWFSRTLKPGMTVLTKTSSN